MGHAQRMIDGVLAPACAVCGQKTYELKLYGEVYACSAHALEYAVKPAVREGVRTRQDLAARAARRDPFGLGGMFGFGIG